MYDPILARSFSKNDQKKFAVYGFLICIIVGLSLCTVFRPQFHLSILNVKLSTGADLNMLVVGDSSVISDQLQVSETSVVSVKPLQHGLPAVERSTDNQRTEIPAISQQLATSQLPIPSQTPNLQELHAVVNSTEDIVPKVTPLITTSLPDQPSPTSQQQEALVLGHPKDNERAEIPTISQQLATSQLPIPSKTPNLQEPQAEVNSTEDIVPKVSPSIATSLPEQPSQTSQQQETLVLGYPIETQENDMKLICSVSEWLSDYCEIEGNIRIIGNTSTILVPTSANNLSSGNISWRIKPYARKGNQFAMDYVREWTVKAVDQARESIPVCTKTHTTPAILLSVGGFSGNYFHGFSDVLIPLFSNSRIFEGKVHFLATNYKQWWISKFQTIFDKLSDHKVIDIDKEEGVQCYKRVFVGLKAHKELGIDKLKSPNGYSMKDFRGFLRTAYSLERKRAIKMRKGDEKKPRLMIISRANTRKLLNEAEISKLAQRLGFEVVVAESTQSTNVTRFAEMVNSCDVLMGVHGAGLTNMLFLPDKAIVIQVVPLGGIEVFANMDFGEPSKDMDLRYLSYSIGLKESSLIKQYPLDHQVIRDPMSIHRQGWDVLRTTYLEKQDVMLDVRRFRATLSKALKLLRR